MNQDSARAHARADRNLLFGILALQMDFLTRDQLVAGMNAWVLEKHRTLGQVLMDQNALDPADHEALAAMVERHVARHRGDPEISLASLESVSSIREALAEVVDDEDLQRSLGHLAISADSSESAVESDAASPFVGQPTATGGRFRVLRFHAKGGLGEVFVARDEEVRREVALKQIQERYADDAQSRTRFEVEAEVTGKLEHPGIVPVYGLGHFDDGRPFYAMRFIKGDSLKEAIRSFHEDAATLRDPSKRSLALRELLGRFLDVCDAIAYAHSRGVLHRDLKPGNVMLGPFGETLVVDWGLAKALGQREAASGEAGDDATIRPESGSQLDPTRGHVGTLGFMPPEQAARRFDDLGPRSDVYSLGATLYNLLTGQAPIRGDDRPRLLEQIETGEFPHPRSLQPWIDPALEAICLKAMMRQPADRYDSARSLAEDLKSWLADEPVTAYREPLTRRARRWGRKHRALVGTATAALLFAALGLGAVALVQTRARQALDAKNDELLASNAETETWLDRAMTSIEDYYTGVSEDALTGGELPPALRERLLEKPRAFYEQLTEELTAKPNPTPREQYLLARGRSNLGRILHVLGQHAEAQQQFEAAIAIYEPLLEQHPDVPEYQNALADSHNNLGNVLSDTGQLEAAAKACRASIAIRERLVARRPDVPEYQNALAMSHSNLGSMLHATGQPEAAAEALLASIAIYEPLADRHPDVPEYQHGLARSHTNLGVMLRTAGQSEAAAEAYRAAIAIRERLVARHPDVPEYQYGLALSHTNLGNALRVAGQAKPATEAFRASIAIGERLADRHPDVPRYQDVLAAGHTNLGIMLHTTDQPEAAAEAHRASIAIGERLVARHPDVPEYQYGLALGHNNLGNALRVAGQSEAAAEAHRQVIVILEPLVVRHPNVAEYQDRLAMSHSNLGNELGDMGQSEAAAEAYHTAIAIREQLVRDHPQRPDYQSGLGLTLGSLGSALASRGQHEEAIARYREAIGHQRAVFDPYPQVAQFRQYLSNHYGNLSASLRALGRVAEAAEATREQVALWPENPGQLYNAACAFALCVPIAEDDARAEGYANEAMNALEQAVAAGWDDAEHTAGDPDLESLREREDFRTLLDRLRDGVDRAMPNGVDAFDQ